MNQTQSTHPSLWRKLLDLFRRDSGQEQSAAPLPGAADQLEMLYQAVALAPEDSEVRCNLGNALKELGKLDEALASYDLALAHKPGFALAHYKRGNVLMELARPEEAEASFRRALEIKPEYPEAHNNLGNVLKDLGRQDEAMDCYKRALEYRPDLIQAHNNLGNILKDQKKPEEALLCYRRALEVNPGFALAHNGAGNALMDLKNFQDAEASFRRALELDPGLVEAHTNLGNALKELGQLDQALTSYRRAVELKPDFAPAYVNLGTTLLDLGWLDEAVASYRRALELNPDSAETYNNLGGALSSLRRLDEAQANFLKALELNPDMPEAYYNLGGVMADYGRLDEAVACYGRALEIYPDFALAQSNLLFVHNYLADLSSETSLATARSYGNLVAKHATRYTDWHNSPDPERCLRIGLVSGDLGNHPVGYFLEGVLTALAANASWDMEFFAYPTFARNAPVTDRIKASCRGWHSAVGVSDEQLAKRIREDGVDILIDLSGHTAHNRLPMFAWKPAPIQVAWLGYFATTGVAEIDYLIADPYTLPESEEACFTEKIWRLPETRLCFTAPDEEVAVSALPALMNGYITFGCFNNLTKMNDKVVALWSRVLLAVEGSRLFLKAIQFDEVSVRQNVIERFAAHGVQADRLILEASSPRAEYLGAYNRVDIGLDPFPYTGGTTSAESLWMGVPVLTLAGERFISRQGLGLMMNAGLPDWVAADADDYVARAVSHAADMQKLAALRDGLRQQVLASPLFDARRFARHFEAALRGIWVEWCEGQQGRQ